MKTTSRRSFIKHSGGLLTTPFLSYSACSNTDLTPDTVYYNGNIITVDSNFSIAQAVAVQGSHFCAVGSNENILRSAGRNTQKIDLGGRTVVPGLIEAHAHPESASLSEIDEPLANPRTVDECLAWIKQQADSKPDGVWITHPKLFQTRLKELRTPTLKELDAVAPDNPVFLNASYGGTFNSAAMRACGITHETDHEGLIRDPATGRLNGKMIVTAFGLFDKRPQRKDYSLQERTEALQTMYGLYNKVGFTSTTSGGRRAKDVELYRYMQGNGMLTIRVYVNIYASFPFKGKTRDEIRASLEMLGPSTGSGDEWIRIGRLKTTIDGGILTGTAYLRQPWGEKAGEVYGVDDPGYRGIPRMTADEFASLVRAGVDSGWSMTAHCTGGGGVDMMLDAYETVNRSTDINPRRFSIIHGNFYTPESMIRAQRLNVVADMQPAWFYKDADAMHYILGDERIRTFHPYRSLLEAGVVVSAGSDHMVILDDKESINPYNPWLAMWSMITRTTERGSVIVPEEAISRKQALRCYTMNNAYASFEETLKGSIEPGKLADMAVIDRDYLTCPVDEIQDIRAVMTMVGGKVVYGDV